MGDFLYLIKGRYNTKADLNYIGSWLLETAKDNLNGCSTLKRKENQNLDQWLVWIYSISVCSPSKALPSLDHLVMDYLEISLSPSLSKHAEWQMNNLHSKKFNITLFHLLRWSIRISSTTRPRSHHVRSFISPGISLRKGLTQRCSRHFCKCRISISNQCIIAIENGKGLVKSK